MPFPRGAYENISVPPVRRSRQRSPKATHRKERRTHLRDLSFNWLEPKWVAEMGECPLLSGQSPSAGVVHHNRAHLLELGLQDHPVAYDRDGGN